MYDLLKLLNDRSAGDLAELDNNGFKDLKRCARTGERSSRRTRPPEVTAPSNRRHPGEHIDRNRDRRPPVAIELPRQSLSDRVP